MEVAGAGLGGLEGGAAAITTETDRQSANRDIANCFMIDPPQGFQNIAPP
jgi:hypothetical protein